MGGALEHLEPSGASGRLAPLRLSLPVDPSGLAGARRALDDWLAAAGVSRADIDDVLIAANEACMNAVEHSGTPRENGIRVFAHEDGGRLRVEVRDSGSWREPSEHLDRGHGLTLMGRLTDAMAIEREGGGTTVVLEKDLTFGEPAQRRPPAAADVIAERVGSVCVARLGGDIDLASVERVERVIDEATGEGPGALVVDLSGVRHLDSAGVHMLYRLGHRRRTTGAATCLAAPPGPVRQVLELTNIEAAIPLSETPEAAMERVGR